jgi:hypothetical protein
MEIMDKQVHAQSGVPHVSRLGLMDMHRTLAIQQNDPATVCGRTVNPDCIRALYKVPDQPGIDNKTSGE